MLSVLDEAVAEAGSSRCGLLALNMLANNAIIVQLIESRVSSVSHDS